MQDYVAHPIGSESSRRLSAVLLSGCLHGDERVGPTVLMETAMLLLQAATCEGLPHVASNPGNAHNSTTTAAATAAMTCRTELGNKGISDTKRQWLTRLVTTRRIVLVPTPNALGYYRSTRGEGTIDTNRDFPFDVSNPYNCMNSIAARTLNELYPDEIIQLAFTFHAGTELIGYEWAS